VDVLLPLLLLALGTSDGQLYEQWPRALPASFVELAYPEAALDARRQGTVVVQFAVAANGRVTEAAALAGHGTLAPAAVANLRQWTFPPGSPGGAVAFRFEIDLGHCNDDRGGLFRLKYPNLAVVTACSGAKRRQIVPYSQQEPRIIASGPPNYSPIARSARVQGAVILRLALDGRGTVAAATPLNNVPLLAASAVAHALTWRLASDGSLREHIVVYEFTTTYTQCEPDEKVIFWRRDAGAVHQDACPPMVQVSAPPRPPPPR
jgi:TonB family protein